MTHKQFPALEFTHVNVNSTCLEYLQASTHLRVLAAM